MIDLKNNLLIEKMQRICGTGKMISPQGEIILIPCASVREGGELWIHFLDQIHVLLFGWDRVRIQNAQFLDKNSVLCNIDPSFSNLPSIKIFLNRSGYNELKEWYFNPDKSESVDDTTYDTTTDDSTETESSAETKTPKRGWFNWLW